PIHAASLHRDDGMRKIRAMPSGAGARAGAHARRGKRKPALYIRLPRRRDVALREALREEAARHELSEAGLARWILRAVLYGQHPATVRAKMLASRKRPAPDYSSTPESPP